MKSVSHSSPGDLFKNLITALHCLKLFSGFPLTQQYSQLLTAALKACAAHPHPIHWSHLTPFLLSLCTQPEKPLAARHRSAKTFSHALPQPAILFCAANTTSATTSSHLHTFPWLTIQPSPPHIKHFCFHRLAVPNASRSFPSQFL